MSTSQVRNASIASRRGPQGSGTVAFVDPAALMRIRNLQLRAKLVVEGFMSGLHRSPYHGFSVEFTEYRQYSPGDDLRHLDWKLYARSDRYCIKRYEDETNLRCYLMVDFSRSMGFAGSAAARPSDTTRSAAVGVSADKNTGRVPYDKATYAKTVATTIAYFLSLQRDAVGLMTFDDEIRDFLPARFRPGHLHRLMMCLERSTAGKATDLIAPLEQIAKIATKRGIVVLLSDLLAPVENIETRLGYLRSRGHEVVVMRVLDPVEVDFPLDDAAMFYDLETGRELYVDPQAVKAEYQTRFAAHEKSLTEMCHRLGIDFYRMTTDRPLELSLSDFLNARMRRGRTIARRQGLARSSRSSSGGS